MSLSTRGRFSALGLSEGWVAADSVHGVGGIETTLRRAGKGNATVMLGRRCSIFGGNNPRLGSVVGRGFPGSHP